MPTRMFAASLIAVLALVSAFSQGSTSNPCTENGKRRVGGGVMSMVTRSGSNDFHGGAYEFLRNNDLDSRNFFNPGDLPAYRRNQFGGSVGGPIRKDRLFFFVNYEGLRQVQGNTINIPVPDLNARGGLLPNSNGVLQPTKLNQAALPFVNLYPLPNGPEIGGGTAQYLTTFFARASEDYTMARILMAVANNCAHPREPVNADDVRRLIRDGRAEAAAIV